MRRERRLPLAIAAAAASAAASAAATAESSGTYRPSEAALVRSLSSAAMAEISPPGKAVEEAIPSSAAVHRAKPEEDRYVYTVHRRHLCTNSGWYTTDFGTPGPRRRFMVYQK